VGQDKIEHKSGDKLASSLDYSSAILPDQPASFYKTVLFTVTQLEMAILVNETGQEAYTDTRNILVVMIAYYTYVINKILCSSHPPFSPITQQGTFPGHIPTNYNSAFVSPTVRAV
jgi:hypothetical protein